jgi:dTDP-glucose 4,6-dehydratase
MKNIIVTGGCGFIGSNFIKKIINKNYNIINIDKLTYASNISYLDDIKKKKNYFFFKLDILKTSKITKILTKFKPLYIFNFAAESHVDNSIKDSDNFLRTNINGTHSLLKAILNIKCNLDNKFKFIQISTDEVFGDVIKNKNKTLENDCYNPSSPYSASKASADHLVTAWGRTYQIPYNIVFSCNNYGPNQNSEKFIPVIIKNILKNQMIPVYGNGKQMREWIYVEDNVEAILKVAFCGSPNNKFNIASNNLLTNSNLVKLITNILINKFRLNKNIVKLIHYVEDRPGHDLKYFQNTNKIKKLGWKKRFSINKGLTRTIAWYLDSLKKN